jgi:hypothetical protein
MREVEMAAEQLNREEFDLLLNTSVDAEASRAAEVAGSPLICYGIVLRDHVGQLYWLNRAHRDFPAAVATAAARTVAFVGTTKQGTGYLHMQYGQYDCETEVRSFFQAVVSADVLQKDTLCFARLSRAETRKRAAAAATVTESQISALSQVPEYVDTYYCLYTAEGASFTWDEPSAPTVVN